MDNASIFTPGPEYGENARRWELIRDLSGGQQSMIDAGTRWVLQGKEETGAEYLERIEGGALNNAFIRAARRATNRVFVHDVELSGLEEGDPRLTQIQPLLDDIDNEGGNLTAFAADMHYTAARYGIAHWLVEHTGAKTAGRGRPYVWPIEPLALIDAVDDDDGRLMELRIRGQRVERDLDRSWRWKQVDTVRRYFVEGERVYSEVYTRRQGTSDADLVPDEDPIELVDINGRPLGNIPFVTLYFNRTGPRQASSPFEDIAWMTLRHYRSYIEQAWNLRTVRIPILSMTGIADARDPDAPGPTGDGEEVRINQRTVLQDPNDAARFAYVETTGRALEQGWKDLEELAQQMERSGDEPNSRQSGVQTATGMFIDDLSSQGAMSRWTRAGERAWTETVRLIARWRGIELPEDVSINIREEKPLQPADDRKQGRLGEMYDRGALTKRTYLMQMQAAGAVTDDVDAEAEIAAAEAESAEAARMFATMDAGDDGDQDETEDTED